jgi:2'-5' RNA ligase
VPWPRARWTATEGRAVTHARGDADRGHIPLPAAEGVAAEHRRRLDRSAHWGVPAHVTLLYPFLEPVEIDPEVIRTLAEIFAAASPFDCRFAACRWFGTDVLWLAPDPAEEFQRLTRAVVDRFPGHRPYGGKYDEVIPHLTVGESRWATMADLAAAEADIRRKLPITARIERALLIAGTDRPNSWRTVAELPFGAITPAARV